MGKLLSAVAAGIVGALLAGTAVWGVVSTSTKAPKHNPANVQIVSYGNR